MSSDNYNSPPPRLEVTGIGDDQLSTAQEATPVPYLAGEAAMPARWITVIYNPRAAVAPQERPAKK